MRAEHVGSIQETIAMLKMKAAACEWRENGYWASTSTAGSWQLVMGHYI